eukprot:CAMPEP_0203684148 /NCGR_PEP_ID=MMETSP0090-20130426/47887_1 /ASSEMBLY_ACC=CAM_ASM_001088 /TAXON_ID=426623 /ORGANISM="Chaetoceros affinis, Strain CCMP159" /LENGTH=959 /DNA_ID=CAMNT_0050553313 /DNA_START=2384 /DNA_END=5263 /DNA_ORIENTATION=+
MDDNDVCPLCCEELDISDRQFFPCKCGYQVCMWCWHRIKESESGLCPACRTPYGDDPHEFSAVDMEDVVKANKEKAAAEKREKERLRQQQAAASGGCIVIGGGAGVAGMHIGGGSDGDLAVASSGSSRGHMEPPKDRNQLANMRVIRRNLVYAVGLPPSIATEEILRKPEHFGQYGKISKIVLNRNHNGNGDPRRASASAYVTFAHKEDALACILALDGFYVDARNIRASYGTSKYCSAFIKNVRCNNPDCTYLHMMGDSDDMFTKQEIQAGYVTSGRDVLAKQQQLIAANIGSGSRRRVGSGGPSGTGKVASNPVFPPPTYEEPSKPSQTNLVPPPPPSTSSTAQFPPVSSSVQRFASTTNGISGFSSVAAAGKASRSASVPNPTISSNAPHSNSGASISSNGSNKSEASLTPAEMLSRQQEQLRKLHPQNNNSTSSTSSTGQKTQAQTSNIDRGVPLPNNSSSNSSTTQATAASVVAGVHSTNRSGPTPPAPHTTLTALTPLKRAASVPEKNKQIISNNEVVLENNNMKLSSLRNNSTVLGNVVQTNGGMPNVTNSPSSSISSTNGPPISQTKLSSVDNGPIGAGAIGGTIIGHNISNSGSGVIGSIGPPTSMPIGSGEVNGKSIIGKSHAVGPVVGGSLPNLVGGQTFGNFGEPEKKNAIGGSDLFSSSSILSGGGDGNQWGGFSMSNSNGPDHLFGSNDNFGAIGAPGIWGNESENAKCQSQFSSNNGSHIGINPQSMQSSVQGNNNGIGMNMSGSSALASMLGIQLPTGVGTLRDSLWASSTPVRTPQTAMKNNLPAPTPIGSGIKKSNEGVIIGGGQIPIGGMNSTAIGGSNHGPGSGNTNDIKLLQSLLPGVHITSGNAYQPAAPNMHMSNKQNNNSFGGVGWGGYASTQPNGNNQVQHRQSQQHVIHGAPIGVGNLLPKDAQHQQGNDMWGGTRTQNNTAAQQQQKGSNIW